MYQSFFSLSELPFESSIDARFYYVGTAQRKALEILLECLKTNGSICVLYGQSGSGKTTTVRMLMRSLPESMRIIAIDDPRLDAQMLLATILRASGVSANSFESIAELTLKLREMLEKFSEQGRITTVICDEAQGLSDDVLEQIRLISNIEGKAGKMINFLLSGQDELVAHLKKSEHQMLYGRIKAFAHLPNFTKEEVQAYVNYRLAKAGCHELLFTNKAINFLCKSTKGLPRTINSVCDKALFLAFKNHSSKINSAIVKKAVAIVFHKKIGLFNQLKFGLINIFSLIFLKKLSLIVIALVISAVSFFGTYYYLSKYTDYETSLDKIFSDAKVQEEYANLLNALYKGKDRRNIEESIFYRSISNSVFDVNSINTLVNLYGYQRTDNRLADCKSIEALDKECTIYQGGIDLIEKFNLPCVVSMCDENLTPYYAVLFKLNDEKVELILDNHLFELKRSYFTDYFLNEFLVIHDELPILKGDFISTPVMNFLKPRLNKYLATQNYKNSQINNLSVDQKIAIYLNNNQEKNLKTQDLVYLDSLMQKRHLHD